MTIHEQITTDPTKPRCFMHNKIDGEMKTIVVNATDGEKYFDLGYRLNPAEFNDEYADDYNFTIICDQLCYYQNFLINIHLCKTKNQLLDFANTTLKMDLKRYRSVKNIKYLIKQHMLNNNLLTDDLIAKYQIGI